MFCFYYFKNSNEFFLNASDLILILPIAIVLRCWVSVMAEMRSPKIGDVTWIRRIKIVEKWRR